MATATGFVRRVNRDSTTDSICLSCFKPVARAANDFELVDEENLHICEPLELEDARPDRLPAFAPCWVRCVEESR